MRDLKTTFWAICVVVGFAFPAWNNHVFAATPVKTEKKIEKKKKEEKKEEKKVKKHKKFDGTKIPDDKKKK